MNKLLSIIIPAYNRPDNLRILLQSIADIEENFRNKIEVIVSDDSPDHNPILNVVNEFNQILDLIYTLNPAKIHAPGTNRKNGLEHASADWVMFIDDDDALFTYNFNYIKKYLENAADDEIMLRSQWFEWEEDDSLWICNHCNITLNMITHGKIYRKSFIDDHNFTYSTKYRYNEDVFFNYQFYPYLYGNKKYKEIKINFCFYKFLNNKSSISRRIDEEGDAFDRACRRNTYSWVDSYFFNSIPTLDTFSQEERDNYYEFILPSLIYIIRGMNWIEDNDGLNEEQLEIYNKFFSEWRRLFTPNPVLEYYYCVEEFYLQKDLFLTEENFFHVLDRVKNKQVELI